MGLKDNKDSWYGGDIQEVDREYQRLMDDKYCDLVKDELVRKFINGKPLLDAETAKKLDRRELTNFMSAWHSLDRVRTSYRSQVTSTDDLVNIVVDTGNPIEDRVWGEELSAAVNKGLIYRKDKFIRLWDEVCDEVVIGGGVPLVHGKNTGHVPSVEKRMIFPHNADLDVENLSYCFRPLELNMRDLEAYKGMTKNKEAKGQIEDLIDQIKDQINDRSVKRQESVFTSARGSVRDKHVYDDKQTIDAYMFYEVHYSENGAPHVSASVIARTTDNEKLESSDHNNAVELVYIDKAFVSLEDWMTFIVVDSEIGGEGKINSLRGIAEMMYPAMLKKEQLMNLLIEGDEIRALPKFILPDGMTPDEVQQLDLSRDTFFPEIQELRMNSSSNHLMTPMSLLDGVSGSFATGSAGSTGGEKLPEIKQRIANEGSTALMRSNEMNKNLQGVIENIVYRALTVKCKSNTEGYNQIMWFRDFLDERQVPWKQLAKRKHGRFKYLEVKVRKALGAQGLDEQERIAKYYLDTINIRPPQQRGNIIYTADLVMTGDADRAREFSGMSDETNRIIQAQRFIAGQEWDEIQSIAIMGEDQEFPTNPIDVHQDHIPRHLTDLEMKILSAQVRPLDQLDMASLYILLNHINIHLQAIAQNPALSEEANAYRPRINQAINALSEIVSKQEQQQLEQGNGQFDKEMAEYQLKLDKQRLDERKQLYKEQVENPELFSDREERRANARRGQDFNESAQAARIGLEEIRTLDKINESNRNDGE